MTTRQLEADEVAAAFAAAQAYRLGSLRIRASYLREFADLWPILAQQNDLDRWLRLNVALVRRWQIPERSLGLDFAKEQARLQGAGLRPVKRVEPIPDQQIVTNLVTRGPVVARKARLVGMDELRAWERAQAAAMASGGSMVLRGGRDAVEEQGALGWMRVTDGDPCYFCAMLASRGAIYTSKDAASVSSRPDRLGLEFHDSCGCTAMPIFARTDFMSAQAARYRALWNETYPNGGISAFRKAYDAQRGAQVPSAA